jgi:heme-degrading monooxygenase HmoA
MTAELDSSTTIRLRMIATIRQYRVPRVYTHLFERAYGPSGDWAALFARIAGYRGTELLKTDAERNAYLSIDRWEDESAYRTALQCLEFDRAMLDDKCDDMTSEATWLGIHVCVDCATPVELIVI